MNFSTTAGKLSQAAITFIFLIFVQVRAGVITIDADTYHQEFNTIGASCGLYIGHYLSLDSEQKELFMEYLGKDLRMEYIKNYIGDYPWATPGDFDKPAEFLKDLKKVRPSAKFVVVTSNLPDHLEEKDNEGKGKSGEINTSIEAVYDSIAYYYYHALKGYYDRGISVDILELLNEPGGESVAVTKGKVYSKSVPKLRKLLQDESLNPGGVIKMPKIMGPSCWSVKGTLTWLEKWKSGVPNAFKNMDIVSTHGYVYGWDIAAHKKIYDFIQENIGDVPFYNSEQTGRLKYDAGNYDDDLYNDGLSKEVVLDGALGLSQRFVQGVTGGLNGFFPFLTHNPKVNNAALLSIRSPGDTLGNPDSENVADCTGDNCGKIVHRNKMYWAFNQITSLMPQAITRIERSLSGDMKDIRVLTMRNRDDNVVYIHAVNTEPLLQDITVKIKKDDGSLYKISRFESWITDLSNNKAEHQQNNWVEAVDNFNIPVDGHSVITMKVWLEGETTLSSSSLSSSSLSSSDESSSTVFSSAEISSYSSMSSSSYSSTSLSSSLEYSSSQEYSSSSEAIVALQSQINESSICLQGRCSVQVYSINGILLWQYSVTSGERLKIKPHYKTLLPVLYILEAEARLMP